MVAGTVGGCQGEGKGLTVLWEAAKLTDACNKREKWWMGERELRGQQRSLTQPGVKRAPRKPSWKRCCHN